MNGEGGLSERRTDCLPNVASYARIVGVFETLLMPRGSMRQFRS